VGINRHFQATGGSLYSFMVVADMVDFYISIEYISTSVTSHCQREHCYLMSSISLLM